MSKPGKELYVGSMSYDTTEYDLEKLFSVSGTVTSIHLICDPTGQFKGCGYVRMSTEAEAKDAIASLDGAILIDKKITVSIANPQKMKPQGGGVRGSYKGKPGDAAKTAGKPSSSGSKPAAAKPASARPAAAKAGFSKSDAPKTGFSRPEAPKAAFSRSEAPKAGFSKERASKPGFAKPASSKQGFSKPGGPKSGASRSGKR